MNRDLSKDPENWEEIEAPIVTVLFDAIIGCKGKVYRKIEKEDSNEEKI